MAAPQLSVRSAKALALARRWALRENRSIADIVERALEAYEIREVGREPAADFYARMAAPRDADDKAIIKGDRRKIAGSDL